MSIAHKSTRYLDAIAELRRLTVAEYNRMGELGIIDPDEKVELIEGQIFQKPEKGTARSAAVKRIEKLLENSLGDRARASPQENRALVRLQDPVRETVERDAVAPTSLNYSNLRNAIIIENSAANSYLD